MDIADPFPVPEDGNKYKMVVSDYFSKWLEAYAIRNQEATTVATTLIDDNWISRFGVPMELHLDQGRNFESNLLQSVTEVLGIQKTRTTPLHLQSDGMVERFSRTMEELAQVVAENQKDWDRHLPLFWLIDQLSMTRRVRHRRG